VRRPIATALLILAGCSFIGPAGRPDAGLDANDAGVDAPLVAVGALEAFGADDVVSGWAAAPSLLAAPVDVALYFDGDPATGELIGTVKASLPHPGAAADAGVPGDHGFRFAVPNRLRDGRPRTLRAFALAGPQAVELFGSPSSVRTCATAPPRTEPMPGELVLALRSRHNGKYVSAVCGGDDEGVLIADRDSPGEDGTFYVALLDGGVNLRSSRGRYWSAELGGGAAVHANRPAGGTWEQFVLEGALAPGATLSLVTADRTHRVSVNPDGVVHAEAIGPGVTEQFTVQLAGPAVTARKGLVRAESRTFVDDDGPFYPLGATLFWAMYGWKFERERLQQNLWWLKAHRFDYVRILGEVDWAGEAIDPAWPDYEQVLGELIDFAYDSCGLRIELTLVGGSGDPMAIAQKVAPVINAGRRHKILNLEVANESYARPMTLQQLQDTGRWLLLNTQNLVALSSSEGLGSYVTNPVWPADYVSTYAPPGVANLGTTHMARSFDEEGWLAVRRPWEFRDLPFPVSHNEPIGPRSSVAQETDPVRLAMLRATGLINGVGAFVLHNAAGVYGRIDTTRDRPANLWEVPGIDAIMVAVRRVDAFMPARAGEGEHWNHGWAGAPWVADAFWTSGADHGLVRNYTVATPDGWVSTELGLKDWALFTATRHSRVEVFDVLKGKTQETELQAGGTLHLDADSRDDRGYGAFIVVGHHLP
jgi:hypothetical protein